MLIPGAKPTLPKRKGRKQEVKVEEEPTYEFDPSSLKRTNEIDLEELEIKTGESRVAVRPVIPDDDDIVIVDDSNKDKKRTKKISFNKINNCLMIASVILLIIILWKAKEVQILESIENL